MSCKQVPEQTIHAMPLLTGIVLVGRQISMMTICQPALHKVPPFGSTGGRKIN